MNIETEININLKIKQEGFSFFRFNQTTSPPIGFGLACIEEQFTYLWWAFPYVFLRWDLSYDIVTMFGKKPYRCFLQGLLRLVNHYAECLFSYIYLDFERLFIALVHWLMMFAFGMVLLLG